MKRLIPILLLMASVSLGANDFSGDANCVALYKFDSAITDGTAKGNDLVDSGTDDDTTNKMQGTASRGFVSSNPDYAYRNDADLSAGFPGKSTNNDQQFSICAWIRATAWPTGSQSHAVTSKLETDKYSYAMLFRAGVTTAYARLFIGTGANSGEVLNHATELDTGDWYHLTMTFNNTTHTGTICIIDANQAGVGSNVTKTDFSAWNISTGRFAAGIYVDLSADFAWHGNIDELVIFNDVITAEESALIAAGTYGAAASSSDRHRKTVISRRRH